MGYYGAREEKFPNVLIHYLSEREKQICKTFNSLNQNKKIMAQNWMFQKKIESKNSG